MSNHDFGADQIITWRDGEYKALPVMIVVVVIYDGKNWAYRIPEDSYDDFVCWVSGMWENHEDPMDHSVETDVEYLARIGVQIGILG